MAKLNNNLLKNVLSSWKLFLQSLLSKNTQLYEQNNVAHVYVQ